MIPIAIVLGILEKLREEAMEAAEAPDETKQTAFGFGRVAGMLQFTTRAVALMNEAAEVSQRGEPQPSFEGDKDEE